MVNHNPVARLDTPDCSPDKKGQDEDVEDGDNDVESGGVLNTHHHNQCTQDDYPSSSRAEAGIAQLDVVEPVW